MLWSVTQVPHGMTRGEVKVANTLGIKLVFTEL